MALCPVEPRLPAGPAQLGRLRPRPAAGGSPPARPGRVHGAPMAGVVGPGQQPMHQSAGAAPDLAGRRRQSVARRAGRLGRRAAPAGRPAAGRRRTVPSRPRGGGHARQGRAAQSAGRTDPVPARDPPGAARADLHRSGLDHEVLRAGSVAAQLADPLSRRPGLYGVLRVVEKPHGRRPRPGPGRLPAPGCARAVASDRGDRARRGGARGGILPGRHAAGHGRQRHGARRRLAAGQPEPAGGANRLQRARRAGPVHRRVPGRPDGGRNGGAGLFPGAADERRIPVAARSSWCGRA